MNRQREIIVTVTYNELGIIIDTKAELRKTGYWVERIDSYGNRYGECTECGKYQYAGHLDYCPFCGAKMLKEGEA